MPPLPKRIDGPVAVIGDVHGQVEKLQSLLDRLRQLPDFRSRWLVFIGDFVDRGPDPRGALDALLGLLQDHRRCTAVAGNHELAMSAALQLIRTPDYSNWPERWLAHYDAQTTFESYGAEFGNCDDLRDRLPASHRELLAEIGRAHV